MKILIATLAALLLGQSANAQVSEPFQLNTSNYKDYVGVKTPVTFVGIAKVLPQFAAEFKRIAESYQPAMRAQNGNITYDLQQSLTDSTEFMWIEEWETGKDLADHMDSNTVGELLSKIGSMFAPGFPKIVILKKN